MSRAEEMPIFASSADKEEWLVPRAPEVGILRFFLLFVFSKESYPSTDSIDEAMDWDIGALASFARAAWPPPFGKLRKGMVAVPCRSS